MSDAQTPPAGGQPQPPQDQAPQGQAPQGQASQGQQAQGQPPRDHAAEEKRGGQRRVLFLGLGAAVVVAGLIWLIYWFLVGSHYVSTDDAYVGADVAQVTPLIAGAVSEVRVGDTQAVKKGDILVVIDASDTQVATERAQAEYGSAVRRVEQSFATSDQLAAQVTARDADIAKAKAQIVAAESDVAKAKVDLDRRQALASSGAVSGEELTAAHNAYQTAVANLNSAKASSAQAVANRKAAESQYRAQAALTKGAGIVANPEVQTAKAMLDTAKLDLSRTVVRAPIDGVIARRQVQIGQRVAVGTPLMTVVPVEQAYVDANFKEVQLRQLRIGQEAEMHSDKYGGHVVYHGRVVGVGGGTGSAFALIPAQNATGNWIKVVQRLPVRIRLDAKEIREHPLEVGLSMKVKVHLTDGGAPVESTTATSTTTTTTTTTQTGK